MNCPYCSSSQLIVKNIRATRRNTQTWRRKQCLTCKFIFTTYEIIDLSHLIVAKRSGKSERFSRIKLFSGIYGATIGSKTPNREKLVENLTRKVEREILALKSKKITSEEVSHIVLDILRTSHPTTFLRFLAFTKNMTSEEKIKRELRKYLANKN